jgi:hypothetical protein
MLLKKLWDEGYEWVRVEEGYGVKVGEEGFRTDYCARQNADRLSWFGLVNHRGPRTGEYQINLDGIAFLQGSLPVPKTIWCRKGEVVKVSEDTAYVYELKKVVLDKDYWDHYGQYQIPAVHTLRSQWLSDQAKRQKKPVQPKLGDEDVEKHKPVPPLPETDNSASEHTTQLVSIL